MLSKIEQKILEEKPGLGKLIKEHGQSTILEYVKKRSHNTFINDERKQELINTITSEVNKILPQEIADKIKDQLEKNYYVNTTDHMGPLAHPFFVGGNLADAVANKAGVESAVITLACSGVSLNNSSQPRALLFHDQELNETRLRFFSLKQRHATVYATPAYDQNTKNKLSHEISRMNLSAERLAILQKSFVESFGADRVLNLSTYSEQITLANYLLWKDIPGQRQTNLFYLDLEKIVTRLIIDFHLHQLTPISSIILDHQAHELFTKHFNNIPGAFSVAKHKGTFLFWGLNERGEHIELRLSDGFFSSSDGRVKIKIDADSIALALTEKKLMPSLALCLIILNNYYGLTCGGGFSQVDYLPQINKAYQAVINHLNLGEITGKSILADVLGGDFAYLAISNGRKKQLATALDLILYNKEDVEIKINELVATIKIEEAIKSLFPYFYHVLTGQSGEFNIEPSLPPTLYV